MTARVSGVFDTGAALPLTSTTIALPAMDFVVQWRRCGMTADYVADYLSYAFDRREVARSVITTAANELLENAAKFTTDKKQRVRILGQLRGASVELEVENVTDAEHVDALVGVLDALARGNAPRLFTDRVESGTRGGLGLIILAKDYAARLGAMIVPSNEIANGGTAPVDTRTGAAAFTVTVRASIAADDVEQR